MGEFNSVKVVDTEDGIMFVVETDKGKSFIPAGMNFYMAVDEDTAHAIEIELDTNPILQDLEIPIEFIDMDWMNIDGEKVLAIPYKKLKHKFELMKLFPELSFYNADLPEEMLWLIHHGHTYGDFLAKPLWFDIEVDPTNLDMNNLTFDNRIFMIGMANEYGKTYPIIYEDERRMLREAYAIAKNYRCIIGWGSKHFDISYLQGRSKALGLELDWESIPHIDEMIMYKRFMKYKKELGEVVNGSLDSVGMKFLGYGKTVKAYTKLKGWFENDWLSLETYCMNDVLLMIDLYRKVDGLEQTMKSEMLKVKIANLKPNKRYITAFLDNKFNELALNRKMAIPKRYGWKHRDVEDENDEVGAGGWVLEPIKGLHRNIVSIDFYSLYPNIYITHNIGVDTVDWSGEDKDVIKTEVLNFRKDAKGLNAEFMDYLLTSRMKYRSARDKFDKGSEAYIYNDLYQDMYKTLLVSANGAMENRAFRYKNQKFYNSCLMTGQVYLQLLKEAGEILGWETVGGDTDSCHFKTPYDDINDIVDILPEAQKFIYEYVKQKAMERWSIPEEYYSINPRCEMISSYFYYIEKKSYIQKIVWSDGKFLDKPRFDAKGMPGVKYNTLPLLKKILQGIFKEVIFEAKGEDYIDVAIDYLLRLKDDLYNSRRDDLLLFSQEVDKLGGRLPHDRAAAKLDAMGVFEPGMMVQYIRRKDGSIIVPEYEEDYIVGRETYDYYWTNSVSNWIMKLLPDVAVKPELGFNVAALNAELEFL